jgi:uncharacterized protein YqjF (DUF2071 family)
MTQSWHDLLFAHWALEPAVVRALVPLELPLDLFDGRAWVGVIPFRMTNVAPRGLFAARMAFPELNVRTYVTVGGKPGVYFFSLDASSRLAVATARAMFGLPYFLAAMELRREGSSIRYSSRRHAASAELIASYEPIGAARPPDEGSLEHFLTERYCLYTVSRGSVRRVDIHHPPWMLQPARARIERNTMAVAAGITLPRSEPHLLFAKRQDVVVWFSE